MKKLMCVLCVLLLLVSSAVAETMMVHITATCYDTNHVGDKWSSAYYISDYQTFDGDVIELVPGRYDFTTQIVDYDSSPDVGESVIRVNVTDNKLSKGFKVEQYLTVTEDRNRYAGNWCEWYITYEFIPCTPGVTTVLH